MKLTPITIQYGLRRRTVVRRSSLKEAAFPQAPGTNNEVRQEEREKKRGSGCKKVTAEIEETSRV